MPRFYTLLRQLWHFASAKPAIMDYFRYHIKELNNTQDLSQKHDCIYSRNIITQKLRFVIIRQDK